jgi:myo-inositol-1(or 4)-monophosphatase
MNDLLSIFSFVEDINREAGRIIRGYYGTELEIISKPDLSPVTKADREVETMMRDAIEKRFPDHSILGEEFGETTRPSAYRWIIDPIDGTQTFILRTPLFGTLLALERDGEPILGSIYLPIQDQLLIGSAETGTFLEGRRCSVSKTPDLKSAKLLITDPAALAGVERDEGFVKLCRSVKLVRGFGDCYGYFLVASGAADIMIDLIMNYHDVAPMPPLIKGAGGRLTALSGAPDPRAGNCVATNGLLHDRVIALLDSRL